MASLGDVIQVTLAAIQLGQQVLNVYHYLCADNVDDDDMKQDLANAIDAIHNDVATLQVNDYVYQGYSFRNMTEAEDLGTLDYNGDQPPGAGELLPTQVAALITAPTATPKRRGRKYYGGLAISLMSGGLFSGATMTVLATIANNYTSLVNGTNSGGVFIPVAYGTNGFTSLEDAVVTNVPATQRRRRIGVGE